MNRLSVKLAHLMAIAVICVVAAGPAQADRDDRHEGHRRWHRSYHREGYYAPPPDVYYYAPRPEPYYAPPVYVPPPPSWALNLVFPLHHH